MNTAPHLQPAPAASPIAQCMGCGLICLTDELVDGYCDYLTACHDAGVALDVARRIERAEAEALRWSDEHGFAMEGV